MSQNQISSQIDVQSKNILTPAANGQELAQDAFDTVKICTTVHPEAYSNIQAAPTKNEQFMQLNNSQAASLNQKNGGDMQQRQEGEIIFTIDDVADALKNEVSMSPLNSHNRFKTSHCDENFDVQEAAGQPVAGESNDL